ncbi:MAG: 2-amino-4-hydroxy-6-hydroxymethyldihydropteridine diphosphokinase [Proteobacteria bacterium]|nr:2-amino-4-hydroxy-6-hydroxymethyldihydropteridine diphosphokinase [Pseudomonadota bacterium]
MTIVYIGLGSNMDTPEQHINSAIDSLNNLQSSRLLKVSSLYKSKPVGPQNQDDYINAVAELDTGLEALELLDNLQKIEVEHGRDRSGERWGPRTLDLDILIFGNKQIDNSRLNVPHREMLKRAFVLVPLAEINPDCEIPGAGVVSDHIYKLDQDGLEKL